MEWNEEMIDLCLPALQSINKLIELTGSGL